MAKYFLGSVGEATAYRLNNGSHELMFHATSLTDQGINISSSQDELRGGTGAMVQATFNHDTSVQLTLTDIFWKEGYIEAKLGQRFEMNANLGANDYIQKNVTVSGGSFTLNPEPVPAEFNCGANSVYLMTYAKNGTDEWHTLPYTAVSSGTITTTLADGSYCVRYMGSVEGAKQLYVGADLVPDELYLIIKTPLYAGDACAASNGNVAGHITFEIPRFKLDPNLDLSFAMSSNVSLSIGGTALAYTSGCGANGSKLMRIVESIDGANWYDELQAIFIDPDYVLADDTTIPVYGVFKNNTVVPLDNGLKTYGGAYVFTFSPNTSGAAANVITVTATILDEHGTVFSDSDNTTTAPSGTFYAGEHTGVVTKQS